MVRIIIKPEQVYHFVKKIVKDPNPLHQQKHVIVPADLLVSMFINYQGKVEYGEFLFNRPIYAGEEIEIDDRGIKSKGKTKMEYKPYDIPSYIELFSLYVHSNEKELKKINDFLKNYFNKKIEENILTFLSFYFSITREIATYLQTRYQEAKIAVYTRHSFIPTPQGIHNFHTLYSVHSTDSPNKDLIQVVSPYNGYITIVKELLVKFNNPQSASQTKENHSNTTP